MEQNEVLKLRSKAADYAKSFLAQKYREEYQELYRAYLVNRGVTIRGITKLKDERTIANG